MIHCFRSTVNVWICGVTITRQINNIINTQTLPICTNFQHFRHANRPQIQAHKNVSKQLSRHHTIQPDISAYSNSQMSYILTIQNKHFTSRTISVYGERNCETWIIRLTEIKTTSLTLGQFYGWLKTD